MVVEGGGVHICSLMCWDRGWGGGGWAGKWHGVCTCVCVCVCVGGGGRTRSKLGWTWVAQRMLIFTNNSVSRRRPVTRFALQASAGLVSVLAPTPPTPPRWCVYVSLFVCPAPLQAVPSAHAAHVLLLQEPQGQAASAALRRVPNGVPGLHHQVRGVHGVSTALDRPA